jgi:hypothetical protein
MEYVFALEKGHLWYCIVIDVACYFHSKKQRISPTNNHIVIVSFLPDIDEFWSIVLGYVEEHVRKTKAECNADPESQDKVLCQLRT